MENILFDHKLLTVFKSPKNEFFGLFKFIEKINKDCGMIYCLIDPRTKEIRYVGKSLSGNKRPFQHTKPSSLKNDGNTPKANWIRGLLKEGLTPEIYIYRVVFGYPDKEIRNDILYKLEKDTICKLRETGYNLTNLDDGGKGCTGRKLSEESRKKMSEKAKKRPTPESFKKNWGKVFIGCKRPPKQKPIIPGAKFEYARKLGFIIIAKNKNTEIWFFGYHNAARFIGGKCNKSGIRIAVEKKREYYGFNWEIYANP